ncbi:MAG: hypothetical protein VXZ76_01420 [Bacteroidota bacterium]|nr:hypothetical protein [Bacteroidota bacterium]
MLAQNLWNTLTVPLELLLLNGTVELKGLDPNGTRELNLSNSYLVSKVYQSILVSGEIGIRI